MCVGAFVCELLGGGAQGALGCVELGGGGCVWGLCGLWLGWGFGGEGLSRRKGVLEKVQEGVRKRGRGRGVRL